MPRLGQSHTQEFRTPEYVCLPILMREGVDFEGDLLHKNTHRNGTILTVGELEACSLIAHRDVGSIGQEDPLPVSMSEHRSLSLTPRCQWQRMESWLQEKACPAGSHAARACALPGRQGPWAGPSLETKTASTFPYPVCGCGCVCGWVGGCSACALGTGTDRHLCLFIFR